MKSNTVKIIIAIVVVALIIGICIFVPKIISNKDAGTSQNTTENTQKDVNKAEENTQTTNENTQKGTNKTVVNTQATNESTQTNTNKAETNTQNTTTNNGYVEKETMELLFRYFNEEIEENSGLGTLYDQQFTVKEGKYWYNITDGIYLVVNPIENHNSSQDTVASMSIYCEKDYKNDPQVPAYARLLIVANNKEIKYEEAQSLMDEAVKLASQNLASNNGKGISVKYLEKDESLEYQVIRIYK